jgi:hypothetical protein
MEISKTGKKTVSSDNEFEQARAASLKDVPIEQRRREANKPLYLTRYE